MTRWARGNKGNRKRPHDASLWSELKDSNKNQKKLPRKKVIRQDNKEEELPVFVGASAASYQGLTHETQDCRAEELKGCCGDKEKKQRRRKERRLKRIQHKTNRMVCYHCRESGHGVADCPKLLLDEEQGTGVCFRCGSAEHEASKCTARVDPNQGEFPFAKCFVCREMGHLSRSCPDNPRGLYPLGGGCKHCGGVEHRSWACPNSTPTNSEETCTGTTLPILDVTLHWSADAEIDEIKPPQQQNSVVNSVRKKPKIVKF